MRTVPIAILSLAALAGCDREAHRSDAGAADAGGSVHIATDSGAGGENVSLDVPGFAAKIALPAMDVARHVDLDGIRLAPDTKVNGIDLAAKDQAGDGRHGRVLVTFDNPRSPAALIDYYRRSATAAGFDAVATTGEGMTATKKDKQFALAVSPVSGGSRGTITVSGGE